LQSPVIAFDFAVLPRAVRLDEHVFGAECGDDGGDVVGPSVAEVIVGDDPLDGGDAAGGEVVRGPCQESPSGRALFVRQDF
jgi:hypothetical protein